MQSSGTDAAQGTGAAVLLSLGAGAFASGEPSGAPGGGAVRGDADSFITVLE